MNINNLRKISIGALFALAGAMNSNAFAIGRLDLSDGMGIPNLAADYSISNLAVDGSESRSSCPDAAAEHRDSDGEVSVLGSSMLSWSMIPNLAVPNASELITPVSCATTEVPGASVIRDQSEHNAEHKTKIREEFDSFSDEDKAAIIDYFGSYEGYENSILYPTLGLLA